MSREIQVCAQWDGLDGPRLMGVLRADEIRGKEHFSFTYDRDWLESMPNMALDPELRLFEGSQHVADDKRANFGLFLDSCPDRWGRLLMRRREAGLARKEKRDAKRLDESDFLLGVHDEQRLGALRFRLDDHSNFLSDNDEQAAPPWTSLRELEAASWNIQDRDREDDNQTLGWLSLLLAPGSSIGGARPKAGVRDPDGELWIAKFPGRNDARDMGAWEWVVWQLAGEAGLAVSGAKLLQLSRDHHTFASKRFDRVAGRSGTKRLHFASAMTMLGYYDGADYAEGVSYLELAEFISNRGTQVEVDLEELWRRIVFSICVSNTDDHLRNHGFVLTDLGWRLSPAYDINPNPEGHGLNLNISEDDNAQDLDLALEVAPYFRLKRDSAERVIGEVKRAIAGWEAVAGSVGIPRGELEDIRPAFRAAL